jgi:hypothetical protein
MPDSRIARNEGREFPNEELSNHFRATIIHLSIDDLADAANRVSTTEVN